LKHFMMTPMGAGTAAFPRSSERGPIEARADLDGLAARDEISALI